MAKKLMLGEFHDLLKILPFEQLKMFAAIRENGEQWTMWNKYVHDQKQILLDRIYRLKRPKSNDEMLKNTIDHEYYSARIAQMAIELQLMENASYELELRARKEK